MVTAGGSPPVSSRCGEARIALDPFVHHAPHRARVVDHTQRGIRTHVQKLQEPFEHRQGILVCRQPAHPEDRWIAGHARE
jgi:hypothetical protein